VAKVVANPEPVPDPADAKRPGGSGKPKTVRATRGGSLPGNPPPLGRGIIRNRPRYSGKGR
jgi:hypothetical protein